MRTVLVYSRGPGGPTPLVVTFPRGRSRCPGSHRGQGGTHIAKVSWPLTHLLAIMNTRNLSGGRMGVSSGTSKDERLRRREGEIQDAEARHEGRDQGRPRIQRPIVRANHLRADHEQCNGTAARSAYIYWHAAGVPNQPTPAIFCLSFASPAPSYHPNPTNTTLENVCCRPHSRPCPHPRPRGGPRHHLVGLDAHVDRHCPGRRRRARDCLRSSRPARRGPLPRLPSARTGGWRVVGRTPRAPCVRLRRPDQGRRLVP